MLDYRSANTCVDKVANAHSTVERALSIVEWQLKTALHDPRSRRDTWRVIRTSTAT
jgi:hypothetical protein